MSSSSVMPNPLTKGKLRAFPFISLAVAIFMLARLFAFDGLSWLGFSILGVAVLWFGVDTTRWLFNLRYEEREKDPARQVVREEPDTLVSLVFLMEDPREVTEDNLRTCVSHALDIDLDDTDADSEFFVVQYSPPTSGDSPIENFMVRIPQGGENKYKLFEYKYDANGNWIEKRCFNVTIQSNGPEIRFKYKELKRKISYWKKS